MSNTKHTVPNQAHSRRSGKSRLTSQKNKSAVHRVLSVVMIQIATRSGPNSQKAKAFMANTNGGL